MGLGIGFHFKFWVNFLILILTLSITPLLASADSSNPNLFKLLSLNIQQFTPGIGSTNNCERAKRLVKIINERTDEYDVIAFQELWSNRTRRAIQKEIQKNYPYHFKDQHYGAYLLGYHSGLSIYSKFPIKRKIQHTFTAYRGPEDFSKKGVMGVELDVNGKPVYLFTTHLQAGDGGCFFRCIDPTRPTTDEIASLQVRAIRKTMDHFIDTGTARNVPIFLIGDFNIRADDPVAFSDLLAALQDGQDTFNAKASSYQGSVWGKETSERIDYIFNLGMQVKGDSTVIGTFGEDVTDHLAVKGVFDLSDFHSLRQ